MKVRARAEAAELTGWGGDQLLVSTFEPLRDQHVAPS